MHTNVTVYKGEQHVNLLTMSTFYKGKLCKSINKLSNISK